MQSVAPSATEELETDLVLALASFTYAFDPWTTPASYSLANALLAIYVPPLRADASRFAALLDGLLRERVKPLFAKAKNPVITPAGRKAITPLPVAMEWSGDEVEMKPWKYGDCYVVTVFEWVLKQLDVCSPTPISFLSQPPLRSNISMPNS